MKGDNSFFPRIWSSINNQVISSNILGDSNISVHIHRLKPSLTKRWQWNLPRHSPENCTGKSKIYPPRRVWLDGRPHKENPRRWERDHVIEKPLLHINNLQNIPGLGAEESGILDDEQLLLLRGPQHSPRGRERRSGRARTLPVCR